MRAILLSILIFILSSNLIFASGTEQVCVNTGTGTACSPTQLGYVNPCNTVPFVVQNLTPPSGYVIVSKFEWFVNGVLVKTTTNPTDPVLQWIIVQKITNVYCKVTYQKTTGENSSPFTSTTFTPLIKDLDFPPTITTSTPSPNYGCTSATVSYSLPETICNNGFCSTIYNVLGNYNITWQAPAGWIQTSLTNKGSDVSYTPDASSAGTLIATIKISPVVIQKQELLL